MPHSENIRRCQWCNARAMNPRERHKSHSPHTLTSQTREVLEDHLYGQRRYDNVVTSCPAAWVSFAAAML